MANERGVHSTFNKIWVLNFILGIFVFITIIRCNAQTIECDDSCKECDSTTGLCTECTISMFLNSTTQLCQFCDDGSYFNPTKEICEECGNSCTYHCQYQTKCFECPTGQSFSLLKLKCVDACEASEIEVESSLIHDLRICRNLGYYVNPQSESVLELGTRTHPYKTLNMLFRDLFNFVSFEEKSVTINLLQSATHNILHDDVFLYGMYNLTISPYTLSNLEEFVASDSASRVTIRVRRSGITMRSSQSRFILLSSNDYNSSKIEAMHTYYKNSLNDPKVSFPLMASSVTFNNIKFVDHSAMLELDDITLFEVQSLHQNVSRTVKFINNDFKLYGTLMKSPHLINVTVENANFIDYYNMDAGFIFATECDSSGYLQAELLFDEITFEAEDSDIGKYKTGSFIRSSSPANITIKNSQLFVHHDYVEDVNVIHIEDTGYCTPEDDIVQFVIFENNTLRFSSDNKATKNIFNNFYVNFINANKRDKRVYVTDNTFLNMHDAQYPFLEVQLYSAGNVYVTGNTFKNLSSIDNMVEVLAYDDVVIEDNIFDSCITSSKSFLVTDNSSNVSISNLKVTGTTPGSSILASELVQISTKALGTATIQNSSFSNNYVKDGVIHVLSTVGVLNFVGNKFSEDVVQSFTNYITIANPYSMSISKSTFTDISDDRSNNRLTQLFAFESLNLEIDGETLIKDLTITNVTISVLSITTVYGTSNNLTQYIYLENVVIKDAYYLARNPIISFGPFYSNEPVQIVVTNFTFDSLVFEDTANLMYVNWQTPLPVIVRTCIFQYNEGGYVLVEPVTTAAGSHLVNMEMNDVRVFENDFRYQTFMVIRNLCDIKIENCRMNRNSAYFRGTLISIRNINSNVELRNCNFNNNNGVTGGLFYVYRRSVLSVYNSTLFSNYAVSAAIAYVNSDATLNIEDCEIYRNKAITIGLVEIVDTVLASSFIHNSIYSNSLVLMETTIQELDDPSICIDLCFAKEGYLTYLSENRTELDQVVTRALFAVTEGILHINEDNSFYKMDQLSIGYSFRSTFTMIGCSVQDMNIRSHLFTLITSEFKISDCSISNITRDSDATGRIMSIEANSDANLTNLAFKDLTIGIISVSDSTIQLNDSSIENVTAPGYISEIYKSDGIVFKNVTVVDCETIKYIGIMNFRDSTVELIAHSYFEESQLLTMIFRNTIVKLFTNNTMNGINRGISVRSGSSAVITNSKFINMVQNIKENQLYQSEIEESGAAIEILDSDTIIDKCQFIDNVAIDGGAIYIDCNYRTPCSNQITNSYFKNNTALLRGGAIKYNSYSPFFANNTYINNTAQFRPNVASYAVTIKQVVNGELADIKELNNVPSGITMANNITLAIVNAEGNYIMTNDNESSIKFASVDSNTAVKGQTNVQVESGIGTFSDTEFIAAPGRSKVLYKIESTAINYAMIQYMDPVKYASQLISVNFRWCMPGEIQIGNTCSLCGAGSYSLIWNSTECYNCPDHAYCEGKEINLDKGYWRRDANSTDIIECPNEIACLGGFNESNAHPVNCKDGYTGYLCNECITVGDTKYERISDNMCSKCPDPTFNIIRIVGFGILIIVFLIILVAVNLQKKEDSNISVLMRIMTNYVQILAAAMAFNLDFPNYLAGALSSAQRVGESSGIFLSFDCLLMHSPFVNAFDNVAYFKVLCMCLIPLMLIGVSAAIYRLWFLRDSYKFKRYLCVTVITVLFVLHPSLTQYCLRIFKCVSIGDGMKQVEMDIPTECWSPIHLKWIFALGVPMIILYVIGVPALGFLVLFKNRNNLNKPEVLSYILLLYQGLKHERYYWELCNTARKIILLSLHVFIPNNVKIMKGLFGVLTLFFFSTLQLRLRPFKIDAITKLEGREMLSSLLTLYGGLIFVQDETPLYALNITFFAIIMLANLRFLVLWIFCVLTVYKKYKYAEMIGAWIKKAFCIDVSLEDEDYLCYKSKLTTSQNSKSKSYESKHKNITKTLNKYTTNQNIMDKYDDKYDSKYTSKVLQELDETFQSMRTPKQLLSKTKRAGEKSSSRDQQKMNFVQSNKLKRKKKFKTVKRLIKPKKTNKTTVNDTKHKQETNHAADFFGVRINRTDHNTKMDIFTQNMLHEEEKEPSKVKIFYYDNAKNTKVDRPLVVAESRNEDQDDNIIFESLENSKPPTKHR